MFHDLDDIQASTDELHSTSASSMQLAVNISKKIAISPAPLLVPIINSLIISIYKWITFFLFFLFQILKYKIKIKYSGDQATSMGRETVLMFWVWDSSSKSMKVYWPEMLTPLSLSTHAAGPMDHFKHILFAFTGNSTGPVTWMIWQLEQEDSWSGLWLPQLFPMSRHDL